ncbi:hypothetical protein KY495_21920 [Massilia sp. PAMC28688]|uniref:hypothetical protein n=1 Tax=Massilia sp. PAMC28688 TaxID=2861283 RepID=UPI001C62F371|nr:hypothetical protein [Massilia sp. PAMC28688]QYF93302.1 hypothetical protein KY495_21920 [Massilia sp. PAMC28688]
MLLVAVAWIYVVGLMAATQPTFLAGFFTFFFYCVVPLSILFYLTGGRRRQAKRERLAAQQARHDADSAQDSASGDGDAGGDGD